jgi:ribosome biogenesis SPOUT family RNA methylase Rps3
MNCIFIIEHLDKKVYPWCLIEYKSISKMLGKSKVWFTNIDKKDINKLVKYGKVFSKSVKTMNLKEACVLDPQAKLTLDPKNSQKFKFFIVGGILGDYPPKKRTKKELTKFIKAKSMNLGKSQFSTDNAVYVTKKIIEGKKLSEMKFQNNIKIKINSVLTTILPYKYPLIKDKPRISKELVRFIIKRDSI